MPSFELRDGAAMPYADDGAGRAVLLVHGWAVHGGFFDSLRARLARTHRVLTPTLRGHLGARAGTAPLTVETLGEDIARFVVALGLDDVIALGWSMGAMALWAGAPALGARLSGLIVEEMSPKLVNEADWAHGLAGGYGRADVEATLREIETDWPGYVARFAPRLFAPALAKSNPSLVAWAGAEMARAEACAMSTLWGSMAAQDFRAALAELEAPVLAVHGAQSQIYAASATEFVAAAAPRGAHIVIPGAGHVPHLEAPDAFFAIVEDFAGAAGPDALLRKGVRR